MELKINVPYEVTNGQYNMIRNEWSGVCAHRIKNGKFWIKVLLTKYLPLIKLDLDAK